jgi:hypothetical protein
MTQLLALKRSGVEAVVPALLAARGTHLVAEVAGVKAHAQAAAQKEPEPAATTAAAAAGCQICFEAYGSVRPSLTSF